MNFVNGEEPGWQGSSGIQGHFPPKRETATGNNNSIFRQKLFVRTTENSKQTKRIGKASVFAERKRKGKRETV